MKRSILNLFTVVLLLIAATLSCKKEHVSGITLEPSLLYFDGVGQTETLTAIIMPENAANKKVSWESSDNHVATVHNGMVASISFGKATITVTTQDGNRTAKCFVTVYDPSTLPEMIFVEGGTFTMGSTDGERWDDELPAHLVQLSSFKISKYQVTRKLWRYFMNNDPSYNEDDNLPVDNVSWDDAQEFIRKLKTATGKNYRLPTEAQWEYAARGGNQSKGYKYSGSHNIDEVAWHQGNSNGTVHPVGTKEPNELGIYDMSGNVREWCQDGKRTYTNGLQVDPQVPVDEVAMLRGGCVSIFQNINNVSYRVSTRNGWNHAHGGRPPYYFYGFRLVLPE
ncbi:MAG: SUMF1/EgtB/PvdO family nonheme iron enzyme [Bacteroidetes bacterium]|nr:SUMF1/EgtB/PvdO family nonheme iron enzyme [Bacteroidota bacterium]MCL2303519.1 SUMF1/EgtB/PvdO family nonheme iron enzyme [Lentimicrobiaceae bacterium]